MWPIHTEFAPKRPVLAVSFDWRRNSFELDHTGSRLREPTRRSASRVALRSHWILVGQDHGLRTRRKIRRRTGLETLPVETRGQAKRSQPRLQPHSGALSKEKCPRNRDFKCHPQYPPFRPLPDGPPLTVPWSRCQLQAPEAILACSLAERRRCGRHPPLQVPAPEPGSAWPFEPMPEVVQPVEQRMALLAVPARRFLKASPAFEQFKRPAPDAEPLFPSSLRARALRAAHGRVCPGGLPVCPRS